MKDIDTLVSAIDFNSEEICSKLNTALSLHIQIKKLEDEKTKLINKRKDILASLNNNVDTFKTILNKFKTCYLCIIHQLEKNNYMISIVDFIPIYDIDFNINKYIEENNKKFTFANCLEYNLSNDNILSNLLIQDEKISFKHVFVKQHKFTYELKNIIDIISSNQGYFINKAEFNKHYEFREK